MQRWIMIAVMALVVTAALQSGVGGSRLHLALEDRGDPRPRQVLIDARLGGLCLAFIVSWTQRVA